MIAGRGWDYVPAKILLHLVNGLFTHQAVGRPLTAQYADQAAVGVELDLVVADEFLGIDNIFGRDEWADAGEATDYLIGGERLCRSGFNWRSRYSTSSRVTIISSPGV